MEKFFIVSKSAYALFRELFKSKGVFDVVVGDFGATKSSEVGAGAEGLANVFAERADVSAGGDLCADFEGGELVV